MNLDRVFVKNNNDGSRNLLYLTRDGKYYKDLDSKEKYDVSCIDDSSIIPYKNYVGGCYYDDEKWSTRKIKKEYEIEDNKLIDLDGIYIGNVGQVVKIDDIGLSDEGGLITYYKAVPIEKGVLVKQGCYCFINLLNKDKYLDYPTVNIGEFRLASEKRTPACVALGINRGKIKKKELLKRYSDWRCKNE